MVYEKKIINLSETRFYQLVSRHWLISNRALDVILILGIIGSLFLIQNAPIENRQLESSLCIFSTCLMLLIKLNRYSAKQAFLSAYEKGFKDAATRQIGYFDNNNPWQFEYNRRIALAWREIEQRRLDIPHPQRKIQNNEIFNGFSKDCTWRYMLSPKKTTLKLQNVRV